jgi:hypothetical protein
VQHIVTRPDLSYYLKLSYSLAEKSCYYLGIRSASRLTLPDFLCIGTQRGGTTWLWKNLRRHPGIFMSRKKEVHFFDYRFYRSLHFYANLFAEGGERLKGEVTPSYSILPEWKIRFIRRIMPRARIFFMLRNPIDRAWSHAQMYFDKACRRDLTTVTAEEFISHFRIRDSVRRGRYTEILDTWGRYFPAEQIHLIFYDDMVRQPNETLRAAFKFLGLDPDEVDWSRALTDRPANAGPRLPMPPECRKYLEKLYRPELEALSARFGDRVAHWLPADAAPAVNDAPVGAATLGVEKALHLLPLAWAAAELVGSLADL